MKQFLLICSVFLTGLASYAQSGKQVKWSFNAKKIADKTYEVRMTADINSNWHMYAQDAGEGPQPTAFNFTKNPLVTLDGNVKEVGKMKKVFEEARRRGIKVIGIMDYAPRWLTYTRTEYGVPKDWGTYEELVGKAYDLYRPYIDYVEIWNEPNMPNDKLFLVPNGSGLTRIKAYEQIYLHAATVIREKDKQINEFIYDNRH
jgi:hypothetical protein